MKKRPFIQYLALCVALPAAADVQAGLTLADAHVTMTAAISHAKAVAAPGGAVAIVDAGGHLVLFQRLDGTFAAAPDVSHGKARTAVLFQKPTRVFEDLVNQGRFTMVSLADRVGFTPLQGGVPLVRHGVIVGAIGVSGAASASQDDEIAQAAADVFAAATGETAAAAPAVIHLGKRAVRDAFRMGAALYENAEFKVHASRRDAPGEAEVHVTDTDIFYVLEGNAVLVTGGALVEERQVAAGERRGTAISGGTETRLSAGDVIVIPNGVPHWFQSVRSPFTYYVVKSTS